MILTNHDNDIPLCPYCEEEPLVVERLVSQYCTLIVIDNEINRYESFDSSGIKDIEVYCPHCNKSERVRGRTLTRTIEAMNEKAKKAK